jgi:hypothetical protein
MDFTSLLLFWTLFMDDEIPAQRRRQFILERHPIQRQIEGSGLFEQSAFISPNFSSKLPLIFIDDSFFALYICALKKEHS